MLTTVVIFAACGSGDIAAPDRHHGEIVFMSPVEPELGARGYELVTMNLDGSDRRQRTDNREQEFLPHFSPDGRKLLFTRFVSGGYGEPGSVSYVAALNLDTGQVANLTNTGTDTYPVWSPDGTRIAFLSARSTAGGPGPALLIMNADGSSPREIGRPTGPPEDVGWGDIAWSSDDWILFVVAQNVDGCLKTRVDKIRPDGSRRMRVTDGGPNCTPPGMEQSGDADPAFSPDGRVIYSSRGFPTAPVGLPGLTERRPFGFSSDPWTPGKLERDLSLPSNQSCIEGVPKASPDGTRVLLFRFCANEPRRGITLTDGNGSYRTWIADGFGPDWSPRPRPR